MAGRTAPPPSASHQRLRDELWGLNTFDRHKRLVHDYITYYGGTLPDPLAAMQAPQKTDLDVLRENHRFIRSEADDAEGASWEVRLAKRYYSRLFREYAVADLSRHREGRVGLRWRTQAEVVSGKGQFSCGARGCEERRGLASFELPFAYEEAGQRKQALVKVRVCPEHAYQLHYRKNKEAERRKQEGADRGQQDDKSKKHSRSGQNGPSKSAAKKRRHRHSKGDARRGSSESGSSSSEDDAAGKGKGGGARRDSSRPTSGRGQGSPGCADVAPTGSPHPASDDFHQFCADLFL